MIRDWLDNPLFVKHVRSRLRPQGLTTSIAVVVLLCLCIMYGAFQTRSFVTGGGFTMLLVLQFVLLGIMGSTQVGASVGAARSSGILDFHRVSPQSPLELTLGFLFGAPIREYLLTALTLPFALFCSLFGYPDVRGLVQAEILLLFTAWTLHALSLLGGLVMKGAVSGQSALGLTFVIGVFVVGPLFGAFRFLNAMFDGDAHLDLFGVSLPWLAFVLIHLVALIYFLLLGATRKMESARRHGLSKLQALAAMGTISVLAIGGMTNWYTNPAGPMVALYLLVIAGLILVSLTTPTLLEYVIGLRRARKEGEAGPSVWSDSAPNRPIVAALCGVLLATASILGTGMDDSPAARGEPTRASFPLAVAVGCLTVAYYGLAAQYFQIRFGRRGPSFLGLFLFVAWGLPMVLGVIILASMGPGGAEASTTMVFSASPIVGLAAAGGVMEEQAGPGPAGVAITLALLYTFSFSRLYTTAVRRRRLGVELLDAQRDEVDADFAEPDAETKPKPAPAVG